MSYIGYFSDMFHHLGDLTIELNSALNIIVRSYRTKIPGRDLKYVQKKLLSFLDLILGRDTTSYSSWIQQTREVLVTLLAQKRLQTKLNLIRQKIDSGKHLSESEIQVLDDLIFQVSQQATFAFRKII